jgi:hypothetical protein
MSETDMRVFPLSAIAVAALLGGCAGGSIGGLAPESGVSQTALTPTIPTPPAPEPRNPLRGKFLLAAASAPKAEGGFFQSLVAPLATPAKAAVYAPSSVHSQMTPIAAYAAVALAIKKCWLGPPKPRLGNHNFDGEASLDNGGHARISIYERVEGKKLGKFAFKAEFRASGGGAQIESANARLSDVEAERLLADIARWSTGGQGCAS